MRSRRKPTPRQADAAARQAQLDAERLKRESVEHQEDADGLRAEAEQHARQADEVDPDVDGTGVRSTDVRSTDDDSAAGSPGMRRA